jgi:hypothetical protein
VRERPASPFVRDGALRSDTWPRSRPPKEQLERARRWQRARLGRLIKRIETRGFRDATQADIDKVFADALDRGQDVYDTADTLLREADEMEDAERNAIRDRVNGFLAGYARSGDPDRRRTRRELMKDLRLSLPPTVYDKLEARLLRKRAKGNAQVRVERPARRRMTGDFGEVVRRAFPTRTDQQDFRSRVNEVHEAADALDRADTKAAKKVKGKRR